jgi:L,D-peptidoglycan transpeptidase YkuD (ErfK/YbiS/YcfS/YnhG family)
MAPTRSTTPRRVRGVVLVLVAGLMLSVLTGAVASASGASTQPVPSFAAQVPAATTQVVRTVRTAHWCSRVYCTQTEAWQKVGGGWRIAQVAPGRPAVFRSTIGPRGFAAPGRRREGSGYSPSGLYPITVTFSTTASSPGSMPWRRRLPTSTVTPYRGPLYNTWIEERGRTDGNRPSMRSGFWVGYNHPRLAPGVGPRPVPGLGSGIFYHTSRPGSEYVPTEGCTQVGDPAAMRWIIRWLRPGARPRVANNV